MITIKPQRLNLNLLLMHKWLATQRTKELGPDFVSGVGLVVLGIVITICVMVW